MTILIKGGHVINPATQMDEVADVLIEDQKIKKIGKELPEKEIKQVRSEKQTDNVLSKANIAPFFIRQSVLSF